MWDFKCFVFFFSSFYTSTFTYYFYNHKDLEAKDNDSKVNLRVTGPLYAPGKQGRLRLFRLWTAASKWMPLTLQTCNKWTGDVEPSSYARGQRLLYIKSHGLHSHKHTWIISHAHNYHHTCKVTVPGTFLGHLSLSLASLSGRPDSYFKLDMAPSSRGLGPFCKVYLS